jgi:hypothetical protein
MRYVFLKDMRYNSNLYKKGSTIELRGLCARMRGELRAGNIKQVIEKPITEEPKAVVVKPATVAEKPRFIDNFFHKKGNR